MLGSLPLGQLRPIVPNLFWVIMSGANLSTSGAFSLFVFVKISKRALCSGFRVPNLAASAALFV
jgi:hypothetical protein